MAPKLIVLCVFYLLYLVEGRNRHYKWEVKHEDRSPDCFKKQAITINGMSPGPSIDAVQGDTVTVLVKNSLGDDDLTIHWHGIRQMGTPWSDGTDGVSQCAIRPGQSFRYKFVVDRAGTFLYHSHHGMQRQDGLYGVIRVSLPHGESEPFAYDHDTSLVLSDWYHNSTSQQASGLSSIPYVWVGEPQSLLIQGRGKFNCSGLDVNTCDASSPQCSPYVLNVVPGKVYRLRLASLTSLSSLSFQIEGHKMTVVETDGHYVEPFVVNNLFIYSGESYSVLFKADQDPSRNYWMTTNVVSRNPKTPPGLAILSYQPAADRAKLIYPPTTPPPGAFWDDVEGRIHQSLRLKAHKDYTMTPPPVSDQLIVVLNTQNLVNGYHRWSINNVSLDMPPVPYLVATKMNLTNVFDQTPRRDGHEFLEGRDIFNPPANPNASTSTAIFRLRFNSTVDLLIQNANTMTKNVSETHPWHLHGHDFWVLGYGKGRFDLENGPKSYNLVNPIMKNTVPVHEYGWTAVRFRADNPGVWLFHCHLEPHSFLGMSIVFEEGIDRVGRLPSSLRRCVPISH